jgi:hypothetical protein
VSSVLDPSALSPGSGALAHIEIFQITDGSLYCGCVSETAISPDPGLLSALRALSNPTRLQLLSWLREPERNFPLEGAIADPVEVGVCVSHIQARIGLAQSTVSAYMADLERAGSGEGNASGQVDPLQA